MNDYHSIGQSIFVADKYLKAFLKKELKQFNLNRAEAMTLMMLSSNQALAELHYDKGVMSRTIQSLEEKGLVTKTTSLEDGRANDLKLTPEALSVGKEIDKILKKWNEEVFKGIEDKEILEKLLAELAENARALATVE